MRIPSYVVFFISIFKIENNCSKGHLSYSAWPRRLAVRQLSALFSNHHHF